MSPSDREWFAETYDDTVEPAPYLLGPLSGREDAIQLIRVGSTLLSAAIDDLIPLAPIRQNPQRQYFLSGTQPDTVGYHGEWLPDLLAVDAAALERMNEWLGKFTSYRCEIKRVGPTVPDMVLVQLLDTSRDPALPVTIADVGYGLSQIVPLLAQCCAAKDKVITVEQPEVHVHPRLQAELAEFLASSMRTNNNQFVVETHSEHTVLRLQRLIRRGDLTPEDVAVLYASRGPNGTNVQRLRLDAKGEFLDPWPDGFFPERIDELLGD